jgi:transposase
MFGITADTRVFLKTGITDGRLGYEGLRGLAVKVLEQSPQAGHVFCFCNAARNRIRLLWWDGNGFFIATKRVERGTFDFPKNEGAVARMSIGQLQALLTGVQFARPNGGVSR